MSDDLSEIVDLSRQGPLGERSSMRLGSVFREALDKENDATFAKALDMALISLLGIEYMNRLIEERQFLELKSSVQDIWPGSQRNIA